MLCMDFHEHFWAMTQINHWTNSLKQQATYLHKWIKFPKFIATLMKFKSEILLNYLCINALTLKLQAKLAYRCSL